LELGPEVTLLLFWELSVKQKKVLIIVDSLRGKIVNCPPNISRSLYRVCSYLSPGYQFSVAYQNNMWDGRVRKFSRNDTFPSGLLNRIAKYLIKEGVPFEIEDRRRKMYVDEDEVLRNIDEFNYILRPYQVDGLLKGVVNPYMIFWWATAAGKTVEFSALISAFKKKNKFPNTLILVTSTDLASQHRKRMEDSMGKKIGLIEEGLFKPEEVTVAVINTLFNKAVKNKNREAVKYLENVDYLIVDEIHHVIESNMMKRTIRKCKNTFARHGFSGSPYSLTVDDIELECVTGPPLSKVTLSQLIRGGWIARPKIYIVKYDAPAFHGSYQGAYSSRIVRGKERNAAILHIAMEEYENTKDSILILVRIIKHGLIIRDLLLESHMDPGDLQYIHGSTPKIFRNEVKEALERRELRVVIASQIWNEGMDIPAVDILIKGDGGGGKEINPEEGKGIRSVIQQSGRVLRKPLDGHDVNTKKEHVVKIYDFDDNVHKDLHRHSRNRIRTFQMEKEFIIKRITL